MKTHNGNVGKILCDIGKITFNTLEKFNIPFDEIYFGKPYADVYFFVSHSSTPKCCLICSPIIRPDQPG